MDGLGYTREDIEEGFGQNIGPMTSSALVHSRYWFLSIAIGLVPLIGFAMISALVAWLVRSNTYAVTRFVQDGLSLDVYLYLGCSLLGVGVLAGVVQRVLLSTKSDNRYVTLYRDEQPELYAFVEKISLLVGVPAPSVIRLDAQVGLLLKSKELALFQKRGGRTELIIGLPLLYSLSVRQLAGVITHAFSGYDARACLNGYPFIASVNSWLYRVSNLSTQQQVVTYSSNVLLKLVWLVQWPFDRIAQQFFHVLYRV
ncbi:MAG: M48 family metallopeptidase, partial [Pseudomonadales bacterium]|nr:M48 family metallopeptidase [Pseudomonadales bacterium]